MSQLSYSTSMSPAYEGGHAQILTVTTGRNNQAVEIPAGRAVVFDVGAGTTERAVRLPSATGQRQMGVALLDQAMLGANVTGYAQNATINLCSRGQVWMFTEQAVTPLSPVFVRYEIAGATGTAPALGKVRADADTAKADAVTSARFLTSAAAGGLVLVEWNLP